MPKVTALGGKQSSNRTATAALDPADATGERWRASWQTRPDPTGLYRLQGPPKGEDDGPQTCAATLTDYREKRREQSALRGQTLPSGRAGACYRPCRGRSGHHNN